MSFNVEDLKWINEINRHPHVYVFRFEYDEEIKDTVVKIIDDFSGETVYVFTENCYDFIKQFLDYYGFKVED